MPDTDHFGVSDILVNSPRTFRQSGKMVVLPAMNRVVLDEREGTSEG